MKWKRWKRYNPCFSGEVRCKPLLCENTELTGRDMWKIIEEQTLYKFKWYRKLKGGSFVLVSLDENEMWFWNTSGFSKEVVLRVEEYA